MTYHAAENMCKNDLTKVGHDCVGKSEKDGRASHRCVVKVDLPGPTMDGGGFSFKSIGRWLARKSASASPRATRPSSCSTTTTTTKARTIREDPRTRCQLTDQEWNNVAKSVEAWCIDVDTLVIEELLGIGTFGVTYKGRLDGELCAVKKLRVTSDTMKQFVREVEALSSVQDPNVVSFKGTVVNQRLNACWIVQEYMSGGTLNDAIRKNGCNLLAKKSISKRLELLSDVAKGMAALQSTLLHRDLKPSNIFLDEMMRAKIGDLGLAKKLMSGDMTGETGTYLYMAPEVILHCSYGNSADVWSWGATLVEVLTCKFPYQDRLLTPLQIATEVMKHKMRPELPDGLGMPKLRALLDACCSFDPTARPSFADIVTSMEEIIEDQIHAEKLQHLNRSWSITNLFEI